MGLNNSSAQNEDYDEDQVRQYLEKSQPSIFEIVLEDLLILKGHHESSMLKQSLNESVQFNSGRQNKTPKKNNEVNPGIDKKEEQKFEGVEMANINDTNQKAKQNIFYPTHHSFLLRRSVARPRPPQLGSEHWNGSEEEKEKLRWLLWKQRTHKQWSKVQKYFQPIFLS